MTDLKDDTFYISLAETDVPYTVPKLLKHAMKSLKDTVADTPVYIHELVLEQPYTNDDRPSLMVSYWVKDTSNDYADKTYADNTNGIASNANVIYKPALELNADLQMIEYRLPTGSDQSNTILLMEHLADWLEKNEIVNITDLLLHDYLDEEANEHPFIRVYYLNQRI